MSCFFASLGRFLLMSLDMALRLMGFGEFPGLDFGVPVGGVPDGLTVSFPLSPALKDFDRGLPYEIKTHTITVPTYYCE